MRNERKKRTGGCIKKGVRPAAPTHSGGRSNEYGRPPLFMRAVGRNDEYRTFSLVFQYLFPSFPVPFPLLFSSIATTHQKCRRHGESTDTHQKCRRHGNTTGRGGAIAEPLMVAVRDGRSAEGTTESRRHYSLFRRKGGKGGNKEMTAAWLCENL